MIAVIQRVSRSSVTINGEVKASIGGGLLVLVGIENADGPEDIQWLASKIVNLRIFNDEAGVMNLSVRDTGGDIIVVSQLIVHASTRNGNRPSYVRADKPDVDITHDEQLTETLSGELGKPARTGIYGADRKVELKNDGRVTIVIDTKNRA